jgi:hypothetical protein
VTIESGIESGQRVVVVGVGQAFDQRIAALRRGIPLWMELTAIYNQPEQVQKSRTRSC